MHKTQCLMGRISRMNEQETEEFRHILLDMLADLDRQDARGQEGQRTVTLDQQSVGRLSRMDAMQQQAMARATQTRRDQQKLRIHAALARIEDGEYGYCQTCGEDIPRKRLYLDPAAPSCIACARG